MEYNYENRECSQQYAGTPNSQYHSEKSPWNQFKDFMSKWLIKKIKSADEAADAILDTKKAEAYKTMTEGIKNEAEARKIDEETKLLKLQQMKMAQEIVAEARNLEFQKMEENPIEPKSIEELSEERKELEEKLNTLKVIYGIEISLLNDSVENKVLDLANKIIGESKKPPLTQN